jgi:hypothetical protein
MTIASEGAFSLPFAPFFIRALRIAVGPFSSGMRGVPAQDPMATYGRSETRFRVIGSEGRTSFDRPRALRGMDSPKSPHNSVKTNGVMIGVRTVLRSQKNHVPERLLNVAVVEAVSTPRVRRAGLSEPSDDRGRMMGRENSSIVTWRASLTPK